jgi:hypothetical protein
MPPPNTILLAGNSNIPQERNSSEAIVPGHLVEINNNLLRKHATAQGNAAPWFARESLTPDRSTAANPIDVPYATGETVRWIQARQGDLVYALVAAAAPAIVAGDDLVSNGDGTVKKSVVGSITTNVACIIAKAAEALNNSGGTSTARIRVYAI